jgi:hypothetical protein
LPLFLLTALIAILPGFIWVKGIAMIEPDKIIAKALVAWYGLFQAIHIVVNVRGLAQLARGSLDFPAMPPPDGWSAQAVQFMTGIAATDLLNAVVTLVFVYGYFTRARWRLWLGTLTLTVSMYAAIVFTYATLASGAWPDNLFGYVFLTVTFVPVVVLFVLVCVWGVQGRS